MIIIFFNYLILRRKISVTPNLSSFTRNVWNLIRNDLFIDAN